MAVSAEAGYSPLNYIPLVRAIFNCVKTNSRFGFALLRSVIG